eukprot:EC119130.1.p2 GENE.EC119130.1~~EC119130.1.p2  ORF type:complete len:104 (+),score=3.38 EC119130.1:115-426(+)
MDTTAVRLRATSLRARPTPIAADTPARKMLSAAEEACCRSAAHRRNRSAVAACARNRAEEPNRSSASRPLIGSETVHVAIQILALIIQNIKATELLVLFTVLK